MITLVADQLLLICFFVHKIDRVGIANNVKFQKEGEQ